MRFRSLQLILGLSAAASLACGRGTESKSSLRVWTDTTRGLAQARIVVSGIDDANLRALRAAGWTAESRTPLLQITDATTSAQLPGRYAVSDTAIEFQPLAPFEAGHSYGVRIEPSELPVRHGESPFTTVVTFPAPPERPSATVVRVVPTSSAVPDNVLRMYIEFSAPMSRKPGTGLVHLIDDNGREVPDVFLPLDADAWNAERTRYTVYFDPARAKRAPRPNHPGGIALQAGRAYALAIDSTWLDAKGQPLSKPFRLEFTAAPAIVQPIVLADWRVAAPRAGTRDSLVVSFPRPLDFGRLQHALTVESASGTPVSGTVIVGPGETQWRFTPSDFWRAGEYVIVVPSMIEDIAGNRIGRLFDANRFDRADSTAGPERQRVPFKIR